LKKNYLVLQNPEDFYDHPLFMLPYEREDDIRTKGPRYQLTTQEWDRNDGENPKVVFEHGWLSSNQVATWFKKATNSVKFEDFVLETAQDLSIEAIDSLAEELDVLYTKKLEQRAQQPVSAPEPAPPYELRKTSWSHSYKTGKWRIGYVDGGWEAYFWKKASGHQKNNKGQKISYRFPTHERAFAYVTYRITHIMQPTPTILRTLFSDMEVMRRGE
jgi:hypothetical protein